MIAKTAAHKEADAQLTAEEALVRRPASGTMARVVPNAHEHEHEPEIPEAPKTEIDLSSAFGDDEAPTADIFTEEPTCVTSPLRLLDPSDEEMTREYRDLPTRVMHEEPAPPSSRRNVAPMSGVQAVASVVVADEAPARESASRTAPQTQQLTTFALPVAAVEPPSPFKEPTASPLEVDRALLRALTAPRFAVPPVVAIRPAPPSPRMLAIVAGFTALGMLWVMAVCAMILVLVTR